LAVVDKQRQHSRQQHNLAVAAVEVIDRIREGLVEFLRTSSSDACLVEAYRAEARAALRRILPEPSETQLNTRLDSDDFSVIDHLRDRKVIHTWSKQQLARQRRALLSPGSASQSNGQPADPVEIHQPSPVPSTSDGGA
jgi:hypothetical protein